MGKGGGEVVRDRVHLAPQLKVETYKAVFRGKDVVCICKGAKDVFVYIDIYLHYIYIIF